MTPGPSAHFPAISSRPPEAEKAVAGLLRAAEDFDAAWFPASCEPNAVQAFWFAARYAREKKFFKKLAARFWPDVLSACSLAGSAGEALLRGLGPGEQLRLAVFLDQQPRNMRGVVAEQEAALLERCIEELSRLALDLALRVLQGAAGAEGEASAEAVLRSTDGTAAQLCFLTLALRHTRERGRVLTASRLLAGLEEREPGLEVVAAFRLHNDAVLGRLDAEAYVRQALCSGEPELLVPRVQAEESPPAPCGPGAEACLAPEHCSAGGAAAAAAGLLAWVRDADRWSALEEHPLCQELQRVLDSRGLLSEEAHLLLSFSCGVDSTAHLLLLLAAIRQRSASHGVAAGRRWRGPRLSCLHLAYPNRDEEEVRGEVQWAAWVCQTFGVELFGYTIRLARPHGEEEVGGALTREEYERHTKEIRFRMYRCILGGAPLQQPAAVVLGHHQDDVDENRLDHLQKGHLLGDVEGMRTWREIHEVPLLRPLLNRRKSDFFSLLSSFPTPFLRDSTPAWSVRGSTRALLDGLGEERRARVVALLTAFGRLAAEVGAELDRAVEAWARDGTRMVELPKGTGGLALDLDALLSLEVGPRVAEVASIVASIRADWNPSAAKAQPSPAKEIPEDDLADVQQLLFSRGFLSAAEGFAARKRGHYHTSESCAVSRRAIKHLYKNIKDCQKPVFNGGLTQELGYLHLAGPPKRILVLYDASAFPEASFKDMRGAIVKAAQRALPAGTP